MKRIFQAGTLMLACFSLTAAAQDWYSQRDQRFRDEQWRAHLFYQVKVDVEHVESVTWPHGHDGYRLERTEQELDACQANLDNRRFDLSELNNVIHTLSRVVADNRMGLRDRDVLNNDLFRLRNYRDNHQRWF